MGTDKKIPLDTWLKRGGYSAIIHSSMDKCHAFGTPRNTKSIGIFPQEDGTVIENFRDWSDEPLFTDEGHKWL